MVRPVGFYGVDVGRNSFLVEKVVLGHGADELGGVGEDRSPRLESFNVWRNTLASM